MIACMITLKTPANATAVSLEGIEYRVEAGLVEVPEAALDHLLAQGFRRVKSVPPVKRGRKPERAEP